MKIDSSKPNNINAIPVPLDNLSKKQADSPLSNKDYNDKIKISEKARNLSKALDAVKSAPETRKSKIESLKKEIQNNNYKVDTQKLADKMVKDSIEENLF